jgi:hypothetical protein
MYRKQHATSKQQKGDERGGDWGMFVCLVGGGGFLFDLSF